jgi:predicted MPP superfamily phosphohydrolase
MSQWTAPNGVYLVNGSPAVDLIENFPNLIEGLPLHWLRDERLTLTIRGQPIDLIGITNSHKPFIDGAKLAALSNAPTEHFTILLYHTPDLAPISAQQGIDLQLSGHTHGGQVRLPFIGALFTGSLYGKRFEAGRIQVGEMTVYITRGIGLEGAAAPRVRFLCPPEVILWELTGRSD